MFLDDYDDESAVSPRGGLRLTCPPYFCQRLFPALASGEISTLAVSGPEMDPGIAGKSCTSPESFVASDSGEPEQPEISLTQKFQSNNPKYFIFL